MSDQGVHVFHHPLYIPILPMAFPAPIEEILELREEAAHKYLSGRKFPAYVFRHERPYRMDTLLDLVEDGVFEDTPEDFWELAREVWIDSEVDETKDSWGRIMNVDLSGRAAMTRPRDRDFLDGLPDTVTPWRGVVADDAEAAIDQTLSGFSWSLSRDVASWFACRFIEPGEVPWCARVDVPKTDIIAFFRQRNEDECLVDPDGIDPDRAYPQDSETGLRPTFVRYGYSGSLKSH